MRQPPIVDRPPQSHIFPWSRQQGFCWWRHRRGLSRWVWRVAMVVQYFALVVPCGVSTSVWCGWDGSGMRGSEGVGWEEVRGRKEEVGWEEVGEWDERVRCMIKWTPPAGEVCCPFLSTTYRPTECQWMWPCPVPVERVHEAPPFAEALPLVTRIGHNISRDLHRVDDNTKRFCRCIWQSRVHSLLWRFGWPHGRPPPIPLWPIDVDPPGDGDLQSTLVAMAVRSWWVSAGLD